MLRASGPSGTLRVGYQVAAELGHWEMVLAAQLPRTFTFSATVQREHAYWITQEPLDLVLTLGTAEWLWRGITLKREGPRVIVDLAERPIVSDRAPLDAPAQQKTRSV